MQIAGSGDEQLAKGVSLAAVDVLVASYDAQFNGGFPLASGAWQLSKALLGNALMLKQEKVTEWIEMIRANPQKFTEVLISTSEFQDAFVRSLEGYIKERSKFKRILLKNIFLDYAGSQEPQEYPLERLNDITEKITFFDAKNFSYIVYLSKEHGTKFLNEYGNTPQHIESALSLIYLGLLIRDDRPRFAKEGDEMEAPYVTVSGLGMRYYEFILKSDLASDQTGADSIVDSSNH